MGFEPCRHHTATLALAAAAALAFTTAPSMAASASASLSNISFSVIDLDPKDGIEAGFSFVDKASRVDASFEARNSVPRADVERTSLHRLNTPFISLSGSVAVNGAQVGGASTPDSMAVSGSTSGTGTAFFGVLQFATDGRGLGLDNGILLTPHTRLIVTGDYDVMATALDACGVINCDSGLANVSFGFTFGQGIATQSFSSAAQAQREGGVDSTGPQSGSLQMPIENLSNDAARVAILLQVNASGTSASDFEVPPAPPIPEPETYALMLAGLGALGLVSRRRNRRGA